MIYTIENEFLKVRIDTFGAQLRSIQSADGTEYLWQGDPAIWNGQAPNLFPYIARLTNETYTLEEKTYHMGIHGFIKESELKAEQTGKGRITFRFESCKESLEKYPYRFVYGITYLLDGKTLVIKNLVENLDERRMFFGIGGHPGFQVPLEEGLAFEDYMLEFEHECHPTRVGFTEDCHLNGEDALYPLEGDRRIHLQHDLFDQDAIVLKNMDRCVSLRSEKGTRAVTVRYPDYQYVGFWHAPKKEAPYVCLEPWSSLPSRAGVVEDFGQQSDLIALDAGKTYENTWCVEIH